jgi:hypothetical protein
MSDFNPHDHHIFIINCPAIASIVRIIFAYKIIKRQGYAEVCPCGAADDVYRDMGWRHRAGAARGVAVNVGH